MDDRTLLEMAAKAAGCIDDASDETNRYGLRRSEDGDLYLNSPDGWRPWNPLEDDGDALRLMARLRLQVDYRSGFVGACKSGPYLGQCPHDENDEHGSAATRRAIVRAAAELAPKS